MSEYTRSQLEGIATDLGYDSWTAVPAPVKRNVRACGPDGLTVTDDAWAETFGRLADALD